MPAHLILLDLIILVMLGEEYKSTVSRRKSYWQLDPLLFAFLSEESNTLFDLGIAPCNSAVEMQNRVKETSDGTFLAEVCRK
jgi:hypothetical protein